MRQFFFGFVTAVALATVMVDPFADHGRATVIQAARARRTVAMMRVA